MSGLDINNLLQAGQFSTKRAKSPAPPVYRSKTPTYPQYYETASQQTDSRHAPRSAERSTDRRVRQSRRWPPPPSCEDESDSIAREHGSVVSESMDEEAKSKGELDQQPVIMEVHEFNPERRFVLINKGDSDSEGSEGSRETTRVPKIINDGNHEPGTSKKKSSLIPDAAVAAGAAAAAGIAGGLAAKQSSSHRRKSMSRQDLPPIDTKVAESEYASPKVSRTRSNSRVNPPDYFSSNPPPQSDGLLSPQVIKHGAGRRDREERYVDYNRNANGAPTSPMQSSGRNRSSNIDDRRHDDRYERSSVSGPAYKRASSSYEGKDANRPSADRGYAKSTAYNEDYGASADRKNSSLEYARGPELSRRSSTHRRESPSRKETSRSSTDDPRIQRQPSYRRRQSIVVQDEPPRHVDPSRTATGARPRSRVPPSPVVSQRQFADEGPSSPPRTSYTFPAEYSRPTKPAAVPYPEDDLPLRGSRLNAPGNDRGGRSRSRADSIQNTGISMPAMPAMATMPIMPAALGSPTEMRTGPISPKGEPKVSVTSPGLQQGFWQPAPFVPGDGTKLDRPVGSFRRYSEDRNRGGHPNLPECRRKEPVSGLNDWMGIPNCEGFNICPDCYSAVFQNSSFEDHFKPFPFRPANKPTACDFGSSPWYRIAWLMTLKHRKPDLRLFHRVAAAQASVKASAGGTCPGPHKATRVWYSIRNPETGRTIPDFTVCYGCAKAVEALLPNLTGIFVLYNDSPVPSKDVCALHFLGLDRRRFVLYFDALETTSDRALENDEMPDLQALADEVSRLSLYTECQRRQVVVDGNWHVMERLPEFTVCGECFDEEVRPLLEDGNPMARRFFVKPQRLAAATCQLYSDRMRDVWARSCRRQDFAYLEDKVLERRSAEADIHAKLLAVDRKARSEEEAEVEVARLDKEWKKWE